MTAVEKILPIEREYFLWLNNTHAPFWDSFMWIYTGKIIWIPLALVAIFAFCYKRNWKEVAVFALSVTLLIVLCDQVSASVIKPYFERLRPSHHPDFQQFVSILHNYRGGKYGFVSAHATNGFGIALFTSLLFRYKYYTIAIFLWALINSYSRIYLGVHFISDIIGGMLVGLLFGGVVYLLFKKVLAKVLDLSKDEIRDFKYPKVRAKMIIFTLGILILTIVTNSLLALYAKINLLV